MKGTREEIRAVIEYRNRTGCTLREAAEAIRGARPIPPDPPALADALAEAAEGVVMFCNEDGSPCDGFRFREEALRVRAALAAYRESRR